MNARAFEVAMVDYTVDADALHAVRDVVFVQEQHVPVELERDAFDALGWHVLARSSDGTPIGTGRLTPEFSIGRMAVLADWRGRGVGDAMLSALLAHAAVLGWGEVSLHAQVDAIDFYLRHGFLPTGPRYMEAGIEHQTMHRLVDGPNPVETRETAQAAVIGIAASTRRQLRIYTRDLDSGLLDQAACIAALRKLATRGGSVHVLLHDPAAPQRALAPLIGLGQRLSTAFEFRAIEEPTDRGYPSAFVCNDVGGWYYRTLGHRFDGETRIDAPARMRQLHAVFDSVWERARPCTEYRALGI